MNTNRALQSMVWIALSMLLFILIAFSFLTGETQGVQETPAYASASVTTGKAVKASVNNTYVYASGLDSLKSLYKTTNQGSTVCGFTSTPSWVGQSLGNFNYIVEENAGNLSISTSSGTYASLIRGADHFSLVDESLLITDNPGDLSCTFRIDDEIKKALKDKMCIVTVAPYVMTYTTDTIQNNLSGYIPDYETVDLCLYLHKEHGSGIQNYNPNMLLVEESGIALPVENKFITTQSRSKSIASNVYTDDSFFQVTLKNWKSQDTFAVSIKEIGISVSITYNTSLIIATGSDSKPSTDPAQIGKITTCIVEGTGRYATAPSDYAKSGDILNVNLILERDTTLLSLDTNKYVDSENHYNMDLSSISLANVKDGTVFRYFFRPTNDYLIDWKVEAGSVDENATEKGSNNMSGQEIKFVVSSGAPDSDEEYAGKLVLRPEICYQDRQTGELVPINGAKPIHIVINVDDTPPNTPSLDAESNFYNTYIDEDFSTYYTEVQPETLTGETDANGNVIRLNITASDNPTFTETALDLMGGSDMIIYYKTSYIGAKIPTTTAAKNAASFAAQTYIEETAGSNVYVAYEGRLEDAPRKLYKLKKSPVLTGTTISSPNTYVRNNVGKYVRTSDSYAQQGVNYYELSEYAYADSGEYTGVYARVTKEGTTYENIYLNLSTTEGKLKAGVWAIEFLAYDFVGKSALSSVKRFIKADITDYQFTIQFFLGNEKTDEINVENFLIDIKTVSMAGVVSKDSVDIESDSSGAQQINFVRLRRSNKLILTVQFENKDQYQQYKLIELAAGNNSITVKDNVYDGTYSTTINHSRFTPYGTTKVINYTLEIDASFCLNPNLRVFKLRFKNIVTVNPTGNATVEKTYTGSGVGISDNVNVPQQPALRNNVRITYYYYTGDGQLLNSVYDDNKVSVGANGSNVPVNAGEYVYHAEIADHLLYYGLSIGRLSIKKATPNVEEACNDLRINYREKKTINGVEKSGLGVLDFDPESRDWQGRQQPATGLTSVIISEGRTYFLATMSSDRIPGYYKIVSPIVSSTNYSNPVAGRMEVTLQFVPCLVEQAVSGTTVTYAYDENGNFQRDNNYNIVTFTRTVTVVHDTNVIFTVSDEQDGGTVGTTTMVGTGEIKVLKYVEFTFNTLSRTIAYTITAGEETDVGGRLLNLKSYAVVTYAQADSLTLTLQQLGKLTYVESAPTRAGIYVMRLKLNESSRGCNYSTTQYAYIQINKIRLDVDVDSYTGDYQYEGYPDVTLRKNASVFPQNGIKELKYEFFYYQYDQKTPEDKTADEFAVNPAELRRNRGTPTNTGEYYVRVTVVDDNYMGTGYAKYTVRKVQTGNAYFTTDWPRISGNPLDYQSHITAGQPISEILLDTGKRFTYSYREFSSSGTTSLEKREVPGLTYIVTTFYDDWYDDYMKKKLLFVDSKGYAENAMAILTEAFTGYAEYIPVLRELYDLFYGELTAKINKAIEDDEQERADALTAYRTALTSGLSETRHTDLALQKSVAFVRFYRTLSDEEWTVSALLQKLYDKMVSDGETAALSEIGLTEDCTQEMATTIEELIEEFYYVDSDYELFDYIREVVLIQGMKYIKFNDESLLENDLALKNKAQNGEILLKLYEQVQLGYVFYTAYADALLSELTYGFNEIGETEHELRLRYLDEMQNYEPDYRAAAYAWYYCFFAYTQTNGEIVIDDNFDFIYEPVAIYVGKAYVDWNEVTVDDKTYSGKIDWSETAIDLGLDNSAFADYYSEIISGLRLKVGASVFSDIEKRLIEFTHDSAFLVGEPVIRVTEVKTSERTTYTITVIDKGSGDSFVLGTGLARSAFEEEMDNLSALTEFRSLRESDKQSVTAGGVTTTTYKDLNGSEEFRAAAKAMFFTKIVWQEEEYLPWRKIGYFWDMERDNTAHCSDELNALIDALAEELPTYSASEYEDGLLTIAPFDFAVMNFADLLGNSVIPSWVKNYEQHFKFITAYTQAAYVELYNAFAGTFGKEKLENEGFYPETVVNDTYDVFDLIEYSFSVEAQQTPYTLNLNDYNKRDERTVFEKRKELFTEYGTEYVLYAKRLNNRYSFFIKLKEGTTEYPLNGESTLTYDEACAFIRSLGETYATQFIDSTFVTQQISPRETRTVSYDLEKGTTIGDATAYIAFVSEYATDRSVRLVIKDFATREDATVEDLGAFKTKAELFAEITTNGEFYANCYETLSSVDASEETRYISAYDALIADDGSVISSRTPYIDLFFNTYILQDAVRTGKDYFSLYEVANNFHYVLFIGLIAHIGDSIQSYYLDYLQELMSLAATTEEELNAQYKVLVTKTGTSYSVQLLSNTSLGDITLYTGLKLKESSAAAVDVTKVLTAFGSQYVDAFNRSGLSTRQLAQDKSESVTIDMYADTSLAKSILLFNLIRLCLSSKGNVMLEYKAEFFDVIATYFKIPYNNTLLGDFGSVTPEEMLKFFLLSENTTWYDTFLESLEEERAYAATFFPYYAYPLKNYSGALSRLFESKGYRSYLSPFGEEVDLQGEENLADDFLAMNKIIDVLMDADDHRNLHVSNTLGVLYSTKGAIPTDDSLYYIKNRTQVYRIKTNEYCYLLSDVEPTITGASSTQINLVAVFFNNNFRDTYTSARLFTVNKRPIDVEINAGTLTDYSMVNGEWTAKDYTVYGVYDEEKLYDAFTKADGSEYNPIRYDGLVSGDESRLDRFRGTFSYVKNDVPYTEETFTAGAYEVTYTLEDRDYTASCVFTLTIKKSDLEVASAPLINESKVFYGATMKDSSLFLSGTMKGESGEQLGVSNGVYILSSQYEILENGEYHSYIMDAETKFPEAGTRMRLYFNYNPRGEYANNYNDFAGTIANEGYFEVTVVQADISEKMTVVTVDESYEYKTIRYTDEKMREIITYTVNDAAYEELPYIVTIRSSRGEEPTAGEYLNADDYTLTVSIEDDNYCGTATCILRVTKKAAYISVSSVSGVGTVVTKNGLVGMKKPFRGGSQNIEIEVHEYDSDSVIREGTKITYKLNNVTLNVTPMAIGYYDAYIGLSNSVNYKLVDESTGEDITSLHSFLIISFNVSEVEMVNLDQVYTMPKTITVYPGKNTSAVYTLTYRDKEGVTYRDFPSAAGEYEVLFNFAAEDNNGYEEIINAKDMTDANGTPRGYKLVIEQYPSVITAPGTVSVTYSGKEGEKFSPYTSPYGMTIQYSYRLHDTQDEFLPTTARALGAFNAGTYDILLEIDNPNYKGSTIVVYNVAKARLTERSTPTFAPYAYNDDVGPEYLGNGSFSFGSTNVTGSFYIRLDIIQTLSVGEYTLAYTFQPDSDNFLEGTGSTKLKIVKRILDPETLYIGSQDGQLLSTQDYSVEYNNMTQPLTVRFDQSVIHGYPRLNSDFSVSVKYVRNGAVQTPLSLGTYTVVAEVVSKNYSCVREWEYKYIITKATPVISEIPTITRQLVLNDTVDTSVISGGIATLNSSRKERIYGTFTVEEALLTGANRFPLSVTFTPGDLDLYNTVHFEIPVNVIGYDSLFIGEQKNTELGETASGSNWTDQVIKFSTNVQFNTRGVTVQEGEHGAVVRIAPKSGVSMEYGAKLSDFDLYFDCAEEGCEDCQQVVNKLNSYGVLSFAEGNDYVPDVGEQIGIVYRVIVDLVQDASLYNDMYGYVDAGDALIPKTLTKVNSTFELLLFNDDGSATIDSNAIITVTSGNKTLFLLELDELGTATLTGTPGLNGVTMTRSGDVVSLTISTTNYTVTNVPVTAESYVKIAEEDIEVRNTEKPYNGEALSLSDLDFVIHNTQLSVTQDAVKLTITDESGVCTGKEVGVYACTILINDRVNKYYGEKTVTFTVLRRDVSEDATVLYKETTTESGTTWFVDSYGKTTYLTINLGVDNDVLQEADYMIYIKEAEASDSTYSRIATLNAGDYTVKAVVNSDGYFGEAYFNYRVLPQEITMQSGVSSPYTVEYGSSEYNSFNNSVLLLSYRDPNGYAFNFDTYGGVTIYYSGDGYPKQTTIPTNAGEYIVSVESNNGNYVVKNGTLTYKIQQRKITITGTPTITAINNDGDNLVYGYRFADINWLTVGVEVLDSSGNDVSGRFAVADEYASVEPVAGTHTVTLVFIPSSRNYGTATVDVQVIVGRKVIRLEFLNLTASYDGTNKRNELRYKDIADDIDILFSFVNSSGQTVEPVTAGQYIISATTSETDKKNYVIDLSKTVTGETRANPTFTVYKATANTERIVQPRGEEIGVGESLLKSALTGGRAYYVGFTEAIAGSFAYVEGGRAFSNAGVVSVEYKFTPDDNANFATYVGTIEITIGRGKATLVAKENVFEYGTKADFSLLSFDTTPAGLQDSIVYDLTYNGVTYHSGDIIPAGTYYFRGYINGANYVSDPIIFSYVVEKKTIDIDFINSVGDVVTVYSAQYREEVNVGVRMYSSAFAGRRTYLIQDEASIGNNVEYRYVSREGTTAYDSPLRPTDMGSYDLTVTLKHDNYVATNTIIYRVTTGVVSSITFDNATLVEQMYGAVVPPIVTTYPSNVDYYIIYQGYGLTMPTDVGSYTITVYIDDNNFASKQVSATFRINPKPLSITDIKVEDKAYDGVATVKISGRTEGVMYEDEVFLEMTAETFERDPSVGEHYVTITSCVLKGLHSGNYTLEYPKYDGKIRIYTSTISAKTGSSYMISNEGFAEGTELSVYRVNTEKNETSVWTRMVGAEASVYAYSITVNNTSGTNTTQYKICMEIPAEYRNKDFNVEFAGSLADQTVTYDVEGNYISFYSTTTDGQVVFSTSKFKYTYVVIAAVLIIILIAVAVLFILNPMQHRRSVGNPGAARAAAHRIRRGL